MADSQRLSALLQTSEESDDADEELGAPAAKVYESQSGGIVQTLEDLYGKAESQLGEARNAETKSVQAFEMLAQSLKDSIKYATKDMDKTKKALSASNEDKAVAEGDLASTSKDLAEDMKSKSTLHQDCMKGADDFQSETTSRGEELKALAEAKKIISEMTGGAASQTYSFLQTSTESRISTRVDLANFEAMKYVKNLADRFKSAALAQLANRMSAAARMGVAAGEDPFAKVKGLISDMIARLEQEAKEDAEHKGYCDKEMSETKANKDELTNEIGALSTKIDSMTAQSAKLKEQVAKLSKELADLAKSQAEMDKVRDEEHTAFGTNKAEMEQGLEGVKLALKVLRDYYSKEAAHQSAEGAGGGIIGMLEVVESDFSKGLAEMISVEDSAAADYKQQTKENEIAKTTKEQDVKYKGKEAKSLDKAVAEHTSEREGLQTELDAVLDYWEKITEQCVAKAEPYEERKKRREAEIAGLKEALSILEGEAAFIQKSARHVTLHSHRFLH